MVTPFDCLGFAPLDAEAFGTLLDTAAEAGEDLTAPGGTYVCWTAKPGVELWVQVGKKDELLGMNPHLRGEGRVRGALVRVHASATNPLEGAVELRVGEVAIVLDAPDLARVRHKLAAGAEIAVQAALFAPVLEAHAGPPSLARSAEDGAVTLVGVVRAAAVREGLDHPFHALVVEGPGGSWDVCAPASAALPAVGATIRCRGWVSARVEDAA